MPYRSPARYLAPTALVAVAIATLVILSSGGRQADTSDFVFATPPPAAVSPVTPQPATTDESATTAEPATTDGRTYVVQPGDTFETIADSTGVSVEELRRLNPDADPTTLRVGEKLRLGE